jgi:excisionase family DNA binding protein
MTSGFYTTPDVSESRTMGLMDFIEGQLIEIIDWSDDTHDTVSHRFPDHDRAIKRGAQLIVRESQVAQFVYLGAFADTFGPGKHTLTTDNIPILTTLRSWKYGFQSPFKSDVYFVSTRLFAGNKWGTSNPVMVHDPDLGAIRLRAFGTYDFHVVDVKRFLKEVAGTDAEFKLGEFVDIMRTRVVSTFTDAMAASQVPALEIASRYLELGSAILPLINPALRDKYGLELSSFVVENVSVPLEVERALDSGASMRTIGNLDDFVKYQMAQALQHGGGSAAVGAGAGIGTEFAVGLTMAQRMLSQLSGPAQPAAASGATAPVAGGAPIVPETLGPAEIAKALGVTEADVVASLESGKLKGTQVGTQWRVTRAQLATFLQ